MTSSKYDSVFSLGYRCSSAGFLKSLGIKSESYPFDWMVSRLPIIEHCIQTDFRYLVDPVYYKCIAGSTNNYTSINPSSRQWICNESICYNQYYESLPTAPSTQLYLPKPITPTYDAYGYKCMMNHRNIKQNPQDKDYFDRCVERWKRMISSSSKTLSLYIHPAVFHSEFVSIREDLINDLRRFHTVLSNAIGKEHDGIYIIPVKTEYDNPTEHCAKYVLEEQPDDETSAPGCRICVLWANRHFIDAGEIFMGNCHVETYVINDYLMSIIK